MHADTVFGAGLEPPWMIYHYCALLQILRRPGQDGFTDTLGEQSGNREQSGNKVGTRTPKWGKTGNKMGTKWEQELQSKARMVTKWEQSGNKKPEVEQEWEQGGTRTPEWGKNGNKVGIFTFSRNQKPHMYESLSMHLHETAQLTSKYFGVVFN